MKDITFQKAPINFTHSEVVFVSAVVFQLSSALKKIGGPPENSTTQFTNKIFRTSAVAFQLSEENR